MPADQALPADHAVAPASSPARVLLVNGAAVASSAVTLAALLVDLGFGDQRVATAVNGDFVAQHRRAACPLSDGDRIEIVTARQGG